MSLGAAYKSFRSSIAFLMSITSTIPGVSPLINWAIRLRMQSAGALASSRSMCFAFFAEFSEGELERSDPE
jgi:hypothetical protein